MLKTATSLYFTSKSKDPFHSRYYWHRQNESDWFEVTSI